MKREHAFLRRAWPLVAAFALLCSAALVPRRAMSQAPRQKTGCTWQFNGQVYVCTTPDCSIGPGTCCGPCIP